MPARTFAEVSSRGIVTVHGRPPKSVYPGLFVITLATLMHQMLLTRIFSVAMWYHFAFVAISVTMFGMSVGAIVVFLWRDYDVSRVARHLTVCAALYALTSVGALLVFIIIRFRGAEDFLAVVALSVTYFALAVPFAFSGIVVTLALTKFPKHVGTLYAFDLIGAALGCVAFIWTLEITDGPSAILVVAALGSFGAFLFSLGLGRRAQFACVVLTLLFIGAAIGNTRQAEDGKAPIRLLWARGIPDLGIASLLDVWNSFSRIQVGGDMEKTEPPFAWGFGRNVPLQQHVGQLRMGIDLTAGTVITRWTGDVESISFLKYDVANAGHYLRDNADVVVIGVGGGHDILSALAFEQKSVLGVEINKNILWATNDVFGEFSGHLDQRPNVSFAVDEARSYLARTDRKFDIIQMSLIDTFAATSAGAYVLSENSLYTVEAWKIFLSKLSNRGILNVSRWHVPSQPKEVFRLVSLARGALESRGITNFRDHVMLVRTDVSPLGDRGVGTILVSNTPFSIDDVLRLSDAAQQAGFVLSLTPQFSEYPEFAQILAPGDPSAFFDQYPLDVTAPTDNRPFYFQMLRPADAVRHVFGLRKSTGDENEDAVMALAALLLIVVILTAACILVPLWLRSEPGALRGHSAHLLYFASIGFGFMFVEISQLQQLIVFLGHPTYALSVVLFTLLLSSGIGSYCVERFALATDRMSQRRGLLILAALVAVLIAVGLVSPALRESFASGSNPVRIAVAIVIIAPMGFLMGMAFPLGMDAASRRTEHLTPWLWGTNGAASVCCSVLAMAIAMAVGNRVAFWCGVACYLLTLVAYLFTGRAEPAESRPARGPSVRA